jgi:DNA repair ATPase RecN
MSETLKEIVKKISDLNDEIWVKMASLEVHNPSLFAIHTRLSAIEGSLTKYVADLEDQKKARVAWIRACEEEGS